MRRPQSIVIGAALMCARTVSGFSFIVVGLMNQAEFSRSIESTVRKSPVPGVARDVASEVILAVVLGGYGLALVLYLVLALFVVLGRNGARILAMGFATTSIAVAFVRYLGGGVEITLRTTLVSLAIDILILLALSSTSARAYARRPPSEREPVRLTVRVPGTPAPHERNSPGTRPAVAGRRARGS